MIDSGSDVIVGAFVTLFAVMARRIRRSSTAQAVIAASAYGILLFGGFLLPGAEPSATMVQNLAVMIAFAAMPGAASEMA